MRNGYNVCTNDLYEDDNVSLRKFLVYEMQMIFLVHDKLWIKFLHSCCAFILFFYEELISFQYICIIYGLVWL